jgi:hypothetical protein
LKNKIDNLFPNNSCVSYYNSTKIRIKEINHVAEIIQDKTITEHFTILNDNKERIGVLIIDGCLQFPTNQKKCDFAFWNINNFYFVEIKDTLKRSSSNKRNAVIQLEKTIQYFLNNTINFEERIIHAVVSWSYMPSRPLANATMQNHSFLFKKLYNIELKEGNLITI